LVDIIWPEIQPKKIMSRDRNYCNDLKSARGPHKSLQKDAVQKPQGEKKVTVKYANALAEVHATVAATSIFI